MIVSLFLIQFVLLITSLPIIKNKSFFFINNLNITFKYFKLLKIN